MSLTTETEILNARRPFVDAQKLLAGEPMSTMPQPVTIGWHDTSTQAEAGCFAVVGVAAQLEDLIGEIVLVKANERQCYVYVISSADVPVELSLARRAFAALGALSTESLTATLQVIG